MKKEIKECFDNLFNFLRYDCYLDYEALERDLGRFADKLDESLDDRFTVEEFRKYINSQDSLGDIHYYLSEENIREANEEEDEEDED